jgi:uncharacterized membrane protein
MIDKIKKSSLGVIRFNYVGIMVGVLAIFCSLLPSLLPRPWFIQGFISGLSAALGYGLGLALSASYRWLVQKEVNEKTKHRAWLFLKIAAPVVIVFSLAFGRIWQNQVRYLIGIEKISLLYTLLAIVASIIFFILFILIGKLANYTGAFLRRRIIKKVPPRLGIVLSLLGTFVIFYFAVTGILFSSFLNVADSIFGTRDHTTPDGISQPESSYRSGGPGSLITWKNIGFQGREFVGSGPNKDDIARYHGGQPANDPIRIYAGLASEYTAQARADLAVAELKRTKAFERDVLVIATATGTGWIDPSATNSLEYMHRGNTAIVSQQYSYLPSWMSFLVDQERAQEAGRVLYDSVLDEWLKLPKESRPKLVVYGLSLGSFGGQSAFGSVNDMRRSVDGALFTGTPNETAFWRQLTRDRDAGSPQRQPTYKNGETVRFASSKEEMIAAKKTEDETRILYLQHGNDPVVWFSFDLLFKKPDWLNENRADAVSHQTRWYPVVTFLQIGLDQAIAGSAPIGQSHYYNDTTAYAWASVMPPSGWTIKDSDKLQRFINEEQDIYTGKINQ